MANVGATLGNGNVTNDPEAVVSVGVAAGRGTASSGGDTGETVLVCVAGSCAGD